MAVVLHPDGMSLPIYASVEEAPLGDFWPMLYVPVPANFAFLVFIALAAVDVCLGRRFSVRPCCMFEYLLTFHSQFSSRQLLLSAPAGASVWVHAACANTYWCCALHLFCILSCGCRRLPWPTLHCKPMSQQRVVTCSRSAGLIHPLDSCWCLLWPIARDKSTGGKVFSYCAVLGGLVGFSFRGFALSVR